MVHRAFELSARHVLVTLAAMMLVASASASLSVAGSNFAGKPGSVIAVPLTATEKGAITATSSSTILFLGASTPDPETQRAAATFLVRSDTLAGSYAVTLSQSNGNGTVSRVVVRIRVKPVVGAAITISGPQTIRVGASGRFVATVVNEGNVPDVFTLSSASNDAVTLSPGSLQLAPGDSSTLTATITPRTFGDHVTVLNVSSRQDPAYRKSALVSYTALAFGSSNPDAPALAYSLPLGASYGSQGFSYDAGIDLGGNLSSLAKTNNAFAVSPDTTTAFLGLYGDTWGVTYSYGSGSQSDLFASYRGLTAQATITAQGRTTTGGSYSHAGWGVSYDHTWGPQAEDELLANRTFALNPAITMTVGAGAAGEVRPNGTYHVSPAGKVAGTWSGSKAIVSVEASATPLLDSPWNAQVTAYSRSTRPIGLSGSLYVDPSTFNSSFTVSEAPRNDLQLQQSLSYDYPASYGTQFSVTFQPVASMYNFLGVARLNVSGSVPSGSGFLATNITRIPWIASASLEFDPNPSLALGETYLASNYSLSGSIAVPLYSGAGAYLGARAAYFVEGATLGGGASIDTLSGDYVVSGGLTVPFYPGIDISGQLGYDSTAGFNWQVGVKASITGAFAVPNPIVQALGGTDTGTVTGVVTKRSARGTVPAAGVTISVPDAELATKTGPDGRYKLVLSPGKHTLAFPDVGAQLIPPSDLTFTVARATTTRKDVQLTVSYAVTGQVFLDKAGKGTPTSAVVGISGVKVALSKSGKVLAAVTTGVSGGYSFPDLSPGAYTVSLVQSSLPTGYVATTKPQSVMVSATHVPFVSLGAEPPRKTVTNTLVAGSLTLSATASPEYAPPEAIVSIQARSPQAKSVVVQASDGSVTKLAGDKHGDFEGNVAIPKKANAVEQFHVTASNGKDVATQTVMVFVTHSPLATLTLSPGYPDPKQRVAAQAHVLSEANHVYLIVGNTTVAMRESSSQQYSASFSAPGAPGKYDVKLFVDGIQRAAQTLVVQGSAGGG